MMEKTFTLAQFEKLVEDYDVNIVFQKENFSGDLFEAKGRIINAPTASGHYEVKIFGQDGYKCWVHLDENPFHILEMRPKVWKPEKTGQLYSYFEHEEKFTHVTFHVIDELAAELQAFEETTVQEEEKMKVQVSDREELIKLLQENRVFISISVRMRKQWIKQEGELLTVPDENGFYKAYIQEANKIYTYHIEDDLFTITSIEEKPKPQKKKQPKPFKHKTLEEMNKTELFKELKANRHDMNLFMKYEKTDFYNYDRLIKRGYAIMDAVNKRNKLKGKNPKSDGRHTWPWHLMNDKLAAYFTTCNRKYA